MGSLGAMSRGSADRYFQQDVKDSSSSCPKASRAKVPYKGPAGAVVHQIIGGLRAWDYTACPTIGDFQERAEFVRITGAA